MKPTRKQFVPNAKLHLTYYEQEQRFHRRSKAARKGWRTRRANDYALRSNMVAWILKYDPDFYVRRFFPGFLEETPITGIRRTAVSPERT